jgi:Rps23 Pro-64 3,4-dihydroxylase Tpa1-like proline 4-hydroxylase
MEHKKISINVEDNFLNENDLAFVHQYCYKSLYVYGEKDNSYSPNATGMVSEIYSSKNCKLNEDKDKLLIFNLFKENLDEKYEFVKNLTLYRMYINYFSPLENPFFHTDGSNGDITFLFYLNDKWEIDDGGETQFYFNHTIYGVPPLNNRLVYFDADIIHKATSFRNKSRFTIAIKYQHMRLRNDHDF